MVRLQREIEGVRRHPGVPLPPWADEARISAALLPWLDLWLARREPGRVLVAGVLRLELARSLARAGHWVTVSDLPSGAATALAARLTPAEAGRLTLVEHDYGEAAFAASSFDLVVLSDALHRYRQPRWLLHKAQRELKVDGHLALRALVHGAVPPHPAREPPAVALAMEKQLALLLDRLEPRLVRPLGKALLGPRAQEAIERGAHLATPRFAGDGAEVLAAVASLLAIEHVAVGHSDRLRLAEWSWDARPPLDRLLPIWLARLPALATPADLARTAPRLLAIVARKKLGYRSD